MKEFPLAQCRSGWLNICRAPKCISRVHEVKSLSLISVHLVGNCHPPLPLPNFAVSRNCPPPPLLDLWCDREKENTQTCFPHFFFNSQNFLCVYLCLFACNAFICVYLCLFAWVCVYLRGFAFIFECGFLCRVVERSMSPPTVNITRGGTALTRGAPARTTRPTRRAPPAPPAGS